MKRTIFAAILAAVTLVGPTNAQDAAQGFTRLDMFAIGHGGINRSVGLYVPRSYQAGHPAPVIIALHGRLSSAQAMHAFTHFAAVAERRGALIVYPENANGFWNDGGPPAPEPFNATNDDGGFIAAAIAALGQDYAIDRNRVFLVGYDNGGAMAFSLACRGSMQFAGVAVVSAPFRDYAERACARARPTPMLIMHGERDSIVPAAGLEPTAQQVTQPSRILSASATLEAWRRINGASAPAVYVNVDGGEHEWFRDGARYRLNREGVDATTSIDNFFFSGATFSPPQSNGGARARSWIVYVPPNYNPARPTPLVILLHGRPSSATVMAAYAQMNPVAARNGFIVVYPEGLNHEWNAYFDLVRQPAIAPQDDIGFLKTLTEDLSVDLNIDRRRMYVTGFSNGGFMTLRMACSTSGYFAGFAPVSAELYTQLTTRCQGDPAPILLMHGTADPSVPYNGVVVIAGGNARVPDDLNSPMRNPGAPRSVGGSTGGMGGMGGGAAAPAMDLGLGSASNGGMRVSLSAFETAAFFTRRNHCQSSGTQTTFPESGRSPGTHVTRFTAHGCDNNDDVVFYVVDGGGHTWPGQPPWIGTGLGPANQDINASAEIWNFFSRHSLSHDPQ